MIVQNQIAADSKILKSRIGTSGIKIFKNAEIRNSQIENFAIIGDNASIIDSHILNNTSVNRYNNILKSEIGRYTYTMERTRMLNAKVGSFCSIAWNVSIGAGKHDYSRVTTSPLWRFEMLDAGNIDHENDAQLKKRYETITLCNVGHDVWIAPNVVIITDVKIGNGSVIGAGAIVTKDVEPYSIVAGVPAKVIKKRFDDKTIEALEKIQWWNWPIELIRKNSVLIFSLKIDQSVVEKLFEVADRL